MCILNKRALLLWVDQVKGVPSSGCCIGLGCNALSTVHLSLLACCSVPTMRRCTGSKKQLRWAMCGTCAGARIASLVVSKPELFQEWNDEMEYMSGRIKVGFELIPCCALEFFCLRVWG